MSNTMEVALNELFYGAGIWLGLLIILSFIVGISMKWKYASLLCLPITLFMGIDYLTNGTGNQLWAAIVMFFASFFLLVNLMRGND